jgi:hypothetical protein
MKDVKKLTNDFLDKHWNISNVKPEGWKKYSFQGGLEDGSSPGCYAITKNEDIVYIGLGASRGWGNYKDSGLGARLLNHVIMWDKPRPAEKDKRYYKFKPKWQDEKVTNLYTIGFPKGYGYIACALEAFIISNLKEMPKYNKIKTFK